MSYWLDARIRLKSPAAMISRWWQDWRFVPYDLMPFIATPKARNTVAKCLSFGAARTPLFNPSVQAQQLNQELKEEGFTRSLPPLSAHILGELLDYFKSALCHDPYRLHLGEFLYNRPVSDEINIGYYPLNTILSAPHVLDIFNDPDVLAAAELYLGCKPLLDNISAWWSYGDRAHAKGTQRFHRDLDSYKAFKQFIYLSDVSLSNGPHTYIRGSHISPQLATGMACSDEELYRIFGQNKEVQITGPAGTRFLADTFGFHKGHLPETGHRFILVAQYNINRTPHGPKQPLIPASGKSQYDPDINKLLLQF